jgi:uncharacterized protein YkwD
LRKFDDGNTFRCLDAVARFLKASRERIEMVRKPVRAGALLALLGAAFAMLPPAPAHAACADADVLPDGANLERVRAAVVCLGNQERGARGLRPLQGNARLRRAAAAHTADMVRRGYFAHDGSGGGSFVDRILAAGYVSRRDGYALAENLAWGTGALSTPAAVVDAWMHSPPHRANLLGRGYRDAGIGVKLGVPKDDSVGATFTLDLGDKE